MSTPDLQALFSRLSSASNPPNTFSTKSSENPNPTQTAGESATTAPSPSAATPSHALPRSNMTSPFQGAASGGNDRTQSLLSLLRFGQPAAESQPRQPEQPAPEKVASQDTPQEHATSEVEPVIGSATPLPARDDIRTAIAQENPQDALLRLLNRSQMNNSQASHNGSRKSTPSQAAIGAEPQPDPASLRTAPQPSVVAPEQGDGSPLRLFGSGQSRDSTPFEAPKVETPQAQKEKKPIFTYTNPFEALNASRSQSAKPQTPQPRTSSPARGAFQGNGQPQLVDTDRKTSNEASPEPASARRKLTPKIPGRTTMPVQQETPVKTLPDRTVTPTEHIEDEQNMQDENTQPEAKRFRVERNSRPEEAQRDSAKQPPSAEVKVKLEEDVRDTKIKQYTSTANDAAKDGDDAWESAEDSPTKEDRERVVPVYNFPIKPFVSVTLQPSPLSTVGLREDGVMEISRLKKEFDQLDRSLAAATSKYITYALVKNGGIRIIRQDDGSDRQVFKNSQDRIFSVAMCTTSINAAPSEYQAVLGVGVSGSVYYATISKDGKDLFEDDILDSESLIFPPYPLGDENTSGGALKTRAKRSSRHPEFFAIGRGKSINLIWPATAMSSKYGVGGTARKVDVEKLYKDRALRITTGKAGKDFAFSEDDTLIVSLDKTGRLRFWDIRPLVEESNATASKVAPVEVRTPLLTLATASPAEKSWPTSVLFIDKLRPYTKVAALRYVLVGLKQNHTLQLWDIGLGKAVQELNFPHETETDGICSVAYHPNTGVIVVGHPTRNSIYFIHLSAPRYGLTPMSQAMYLEKVAFKDADLAKPDSTACMSGIRELSFAAKGQLRSLELLPVHKGPELTKEAADLLPLFELYVVHSRGVTCLNIRKEDLGWSSESKVLHPVDATETGVITVKDLRLGAVIDEPPEPDVLPVEAPQPPKSTKKKSSKKAAEPSDAQTSTQNDQDISGATHPTVVLPQSNGVKSEDVTKTETPSVKEGKKGKKKPTAANSVALADEKATLEPSSRSISPAKLHPTDTTIQPQESSATTSTMNYNNTRPRTPVQAPKMSATHAEPDRVTLGISGDWLDKELKKIQSSVSSEFERRLTDLYNHIQSDRNVQDSAAVARQEALLRLVSTTLTNNVEKSMQRIMSAQMQQVLVPSITSVTVQAVSAQVGEAIARVLHQLVPHELGNQLPVAINAAMQNPQTSRVISEAVSQRVTNHVESYLADLMRTTITPSFKKMATAVAEKTAVEVENRFIAQIQQAKADNEITNTKIGEIFDALNKIGDTLESMTTSQVEFQAQILNDRNRLNQLSQIAGLDAARSSRQVSTARRAPASAAIAPPTARHVQPSPAPVAAIAPPPPAPATKQLQAPPQTSESDIEVAEISQLMENGQYEEASVRWLQSSQTTELFDKLFMRFTPDYLSTDVSALVAFSVGITVGNSLNTNTSRRLDWIMAAFGAVDLRDSEIADLSQHAPALINSLLQKLEHVYTDTAQRDPNDPILEQIRQLMHKAVDMKASLAGEGQMQYLGYE